MDLTYFVVPPEVEAVYGPQPRELDVMIPVEDPTMFFPYALKWYSSSQLICKGNGEEASRLVGKTDAEDTVLEEATKGSMTCKVLCPCSHLKTEENPKGECASKATLMVLLPNVSLGGVYAIDTGSHNNIIDINSSLDMIRFMCNRVALIPLKLRRVERSLIRPGEAKNTKKWLLQLTLDQNMAAVQAYRDGAVLALDRAKNLALPMPDRDITDDKVPLDVTDLEDIGTGQAEGGEPSASPPATAGTTVPPSTPAAESERATPAAVTGEAPPAQQEREPGADEQEGGKETELEGIKAELRAAKDFPALDGVWKDRVMKNKGLDGKAKFELQELLLERKKEIKKRKS